MTNEPANILNISDARAKRSDFAAHTGFDTAGSYLKSVREQKGMPLETVSERTHIKIEHLRGIETGDLSLLPPRAYVSGFVKTYAAFLGLEPGPIVSRFREDVGLEKPGPVDSKGFETAEQREDLEKKDMSLLVVLAVLVFIFWCAWQVVAPRDAIMPTESLPDGFPAAPVAPQSEAVLDATADPASSPDGSDIPAALTETITPIYPRFCEAGADPVETVEVSFNITADGRVAGARVLSSSDDCFERAALNAIKRWRFRPRTVNDIARPTYDQVHTFRFNRPA